MLKIVTDILFLSLVVSLVVCVAAFNKKTKKHNYFSLIFILFWLLVTGLLSAAGFFKNFDSMPPRIFLAIGPAIVFLGFASVSSRLSRWVQKIPQKWLLHTQSFRVVMEVVLWLLAKKHLAPEHLTWNGRNFDILGGISAPFVAYFFAKNRRVVLVWNIFGVLMLLNVFIHGLLSAPLPFQVFHTDPLNTFVSGFPYIWLPAFVVPFAFFLHILSIRKILNSGRN